MYQIVEYPDRDHFDLKALVTVCRRCHFAKHATSAKTHPERRAWKRYLASGA